MNLNITINTEQNCKVTIQDNTEYLPESSIETSKGSFRYSDTVSIAVLRHNKLKESIIKGSTFWNHSSSQLTIPIGFDGWFTIDYIVLPNKEWFLEEVQKTSESSLDLYSIVYFSDGSYIYKYVEEKVQKVDLEEILEINPVNTTISRISKDYVSICFLRKCYVNLCQQIFNERGFSSCYSKNTIDSELIYKRDLVWMIINVVKYLTDLNQLSEVERIIEQTTNGCNGLCKSSYKSSSSGCGCSQ